MRGFNRKLNESFETKKIDGSFTQKGLKLTIETLEQGVKYANNKVNNTDDVVLVSLLLTLNM